MTSISTRSRAIATGVAGAAVLATTCLAAGPIPESLGLLLPEGPVPYGTTWSVGLEFGGGSRERAFTASQIYFHASNGTDMQYNGTEYHPPGLVNMGNYTGPYTNSTNGNFVTLPENATYCTPVQTGTGGSGSWSPTGDDSWPPDNYTVSFRRMVWVGVRGVEDVNNNLWCISPPFTNYSVEATAQVLIVDGGQSGNVNLQTVTTTVAVTTSLDAYGGAQPTHMPGSSARRQFAAGALVFVLSACVCLSVAM